MVRAGGVSGPVLARRTMGAGGLWVFATGASSPLTVLVGGIPQTYATSGVLGAPLAFAVLAGTVGLLAVGYVAMARHVPHPAPFYGLLARGLSRRWGWRGRAWRCWATTAFRSACTGWSAPRWPG